MSHMSMNRPELLIILGWEALPTSLNYDILAIDYK